MQSVKAFYRREERSIEERRLVRKIDLTLLPIVCLCYWSNYLSRSNYAFAYTSGMRQELNFQGNDFTNTNSVFSALYCVAQIPHAILVPRIPSKFYFPTMALIWSVLSIGLAFSQNVSTVYAIRSLMAIVEASTFSGSHYLLGSWYRERELGKRSALFASSAQLGSLFSGVLQGAIQTNLNGHAGRSGWRWALIIDGVVGIAIALLGFAFLPSVPKQGANWLYTPQEIDLAINRLTRRESFSLFTRRALRQIFLSWPFWGFGLLFAVGTQLEAYGSNGIMQQWFATLPSVSVANRSYYALSLTSVGIASTIVAGICTDIWGRRWLTAFPAAIGLIISSSVLLAWDNISISTKWAMFSLGGLGYIQQGPFFAWASSAGRSDVERAATLFGMNMNAWWILIFWPVSTAPRYTRGMISTIPIAVATMVIASGLRYIELRQRRKHRNEAAEEELADPLPNEKPLDSKF